MEITEIIMDALVYPLNTVKSLILFVIIGAITGILGGASLIAMATQVSGNNVVAAGGFGFIGTLVMIIGTLLISGYGLDIVKYGIERRDDGPGIDIVRQVLNAIKAIIAYAFIFGFIFIALIYHLVYLTDLHPLKASSPTTTSSFELSTTTSRFLHPSNADSPMSVTLLGISIFVKPEQFLKAPYSMLLTFEGILMYFKLEQL